MLLIICTTALLASLLTLFSGFGLGTILLPAFTLFFPVSVSIAMTGIVHFANNLFKLALLGRKADMQIVIRFGAPAILSAFLGARALMFISNLPMIASYEAMGHIFYVSPIKLTVALLMLIFAALEAVPALDEIAFDRKYLPLGGLMSGFFGGLSGHQGALRSAFLIRCGLSQESFVATGVVTACLIDVTRLTVYASHFSNLNLGENAVTLSAAALSAFLGAWIGNRILKKVTLRTVRMVVALLLIIFAIGLGAGIL
jgi:uncharacterized protein